MHTYLPSRKPRLHAAWPALRLMAARRRAGEVTAASLCASCGNATSAVQGLQPNARLNDFLLAYHLFGFLWTNQFIQGVVLLTVAGAVSEYYFAEVRGPRRAGAV